MSDDYQDYYYFYHDYYYFLAAVGRKAPFIAERLLALVGSSVLPLPERLLLVIDDSPTKRFGPWVKSDVHHNPTPTTAARRRPPADRPYLYGHI